MGIQEALIGTQTHPKLLINAGDEIGLEELLTFTKVVLARWVPDIPHKFDTDLTPAMQQNPARRLYIFLSLPYVSRFVYHLEQCLYYKH